MMTEKAKSQDVLLGDYEDQEQQYQVMMIEAEDYRNDLEGTRLVFSLSPSLSLCLFLSLLPSHSRFLSLSLSLPLCPSPPTLTHSSFPYSLNPSLSPSLSLSLCLSHSLPPSLSYLPTSLPPSLSPSLPSTLSLYSSLPFCVSIFSVSTSFPLSLILSPFPSPSLFKI